ncbi:MAG: hypothetical protein JNM18_18120 [Planctomycetaceae bacterium]|nr:hypothetical protein [Planctomycetaceae bacterium]
MNDFLTDKKLEVQQGKRSQRLFDDYHAAAERMLAIVDGQTLLVRLTKPNNFFRKLYDWYEHGRSPGQKRKNGKSGPGATGYKGPWSRVTILNEIVRVRAFFGYARRHNFVTSNICYGAAFARPEKSELRKHRLAKGPRMFTPEQLRILLADTESRTTLHAMILLGLNCAFGNADIAKLPRTAVDLTKGMIVFPRPKTGVPRKIPLWPETIKALRKVDKSRPEPKSPDLAGRMFLTIAGGGYEGDGHSTAIVQKFSKLLSKHGFKRPGLGFYALRHTFATVASNCLDQAAVRAVMGHAQLMVDGQGQQDTMDHYIESFSEDRLLRAVNTVRDWLRGAKPAEGVADA